MKYVIIAIIAVVGYLAIAEALVRRSVDSSIIARAALFTVALDEQGHPVDTRSTRPGHEWMRQATSEAALEAPQLERLERWFADRRAHEDGFRDPGQALKCIYVPRHTLVVYDQNDEVLYALEVCLECGETVLLSPPSPKFERAFTAHLPALPHVVTGPTSSRDDPFSVTAQACAASGLEPCGRWLSTTR